jgi:SAM-dependent methyltransferase
VSFPSKLQRAIQRHGVWGSFRVAADQAIGVVNQLRPSVRAELAEARQRAEDFDRSFGVETTGQIHPTQLTLNQPNQIHAVSYGATDPLDFRKAVSRLPIDYEKFVFIDFGSGKGRVILLASEFSFKRIVGLEFSMELHRIAQNNIDCFPKDRCRCTKMESVCTDVLDYSLPDDNLVCYFCNPFDATLMKQVAARICQSFYQMPREIFILYYNAKERHVFDQAACFERIQTNDWIQIWRTVVGI